MSRGGKRPGRGFGELRRVYIREVTKDMLREIAHERYGAMVREFQRNFDQQLGAFMQQVG